MKKLIWFIISILFAVSVCASCPPPNGSDSYSGNGSMYLMLPPDFFGPGSDPFEGTVHLRSGSLPFPDTVIRRDTQIPPAGPGTIPIEIVALNLVSVQPIIVTYPDASPQQWDVHLDIGTDRGLVNPTLGHIINDGGCYNVDSFFDIFVEVNLTEIQFHVIKTLFNPNQFRSSGIMPEIPARALSTSSGQINTQLVDKNNLSAPVGNLWNFSYKGDLLGGCGDGIVNNGEQCDDGSNNGNVCTPPYNESCSYCTRSCQTEAVQGGYCGDGIVNGQEQCDDGNNNNGDSCSSTCNNEYKATLTVQLSGKPSSRDGFTMYAVEEYCYDSYGRDIAATLDNCPKYGSGITVDGKTTFEVSLPTNPTILRILGFKAPSTGSVGGSKKVYSGDNITLREHQVKKIKSLTGMAVADLESEPTSKAIVAISILTLIGAIVLLTRKK